MAVVVMFALFYKNTTWSQLRGRLQSLFGAGLIELDIMNGVGGGEAVEGASTPPRGQLSPGDPLAAVLRCVAEGVARAASSRDASKQPPEWEARMRALLQGDAAAALAALQRPLAALQAELAAALLAACSDRRGDGISQLLEEKLSTTSPQGAHPDGLAQQPPVRWFGVAALPADALLEALAGLPSLPHEVSERIRAAGRAENYHVTLWHVDDGRLGPDEELWQALSAVVGQQAVIEVVAVDWDEKVVSAQVGGRKTEFFLHR